MSRYLLVLAALISASIAEDICQLPPAVVGPCKGLIPRYTYDHGKCVLFYYGGCGGNANNFRTKEECEEKCMPHMEDICKLPVVIGPCKASIPRYAYKDGKCQLFFYGGCQGNANNFGTMEECKQACVHSTEIKLQLEPKIKVEPELVLIPEVCTLPLMRGPCTASIPVWGYEHGVCKQFIYGGCQGNANRFESKLNCEQTCKNETETKTEIIMEVERKVVTKLMEELKVNPEVCTLPLVKGPCNGNILMYGYENGVCKQFSYGGCLGNENRFHTKMECEEACLNRTEVMLHSKLELLPQICTLPLVTGPCEAHIPMYGYQDGVCKMFIYGGCEGNDNRFKTKEECERVCSPRVEDVCSLPAVPGPCKSYRPRYASIDGVCKLLVYGGCGGNLNNFETKEKCETACPNKCSLPIVEGPCKSHLHRYGYHNGICKPFIYGGCQGNENNFLTKTACEQACQVNPIRHQRCLPRLDNQLFCKSKEIYQHVLDDQTQQCVLRKVCLTMTGPHPGFRTKLACERNCLV